eukprot:434892-Heterocapsa_arctica.AAC.1
MSCPGMALRSRPAPRSSVLIAHAVFLYNRYQIRSNGLTPWEEIHGRTYREAVFHFGDAVLARKPTATLQPKLES